MPGLLVEEITKSLGDLSGKIIIDPTNPLEGRENRLEHAAATSNAEIIQEAAPGAYVVKAFNTLNWKTMVDPASAGGPVSIPLVGDNGRAKDKVAELGGPEKVSAFIAEPELGASGFLVPVGDPVAMADAVCRVLKMPGDQWRTMSQASCRVEGKMP